MIRRRFLLLAVLPLLCGATPIDAASSGDITEVTLERTPCFGACPEDTLILRKDGTAAYLGRRNVERIGRYEGAFPPQEFARLAALIQSQGFSGLRREYTRRVSDLPSIVTSVVTRGRRKTVVNYGDAGPTKLWGVERAVLGVGSTVRFEKVGDIDDSVNQKS